MTISEEIAELLKLVPQKMHLSNGVDFVDEIDEQPDFENNDANFIKLLVHMSRNDRMSWLYNFKAELENYYNDHNDVFKTSEKIKALQEETFEYKGVGKYYDYKKEN